MLLGGVFIMETSAAVLPVVLPVPVPKRIDGMAGTPLPPTPKLYMGQDMLPKPPLEV